MRCSDGQSLAAQRKFATCSHELADQTYTKLGEEDYAEEQEDDELENEVDKAKAMEETATVLCDTLGNIGKTCMKELQACFRRDDVVRTTTNHLESMRSFLIGIAGDKVAPDGLDSCDAASDIDFGPEDEDEDGEEDYAYDDYDESEEVSSDTKEEIKAVIQKTLSEEKREQQQDEPKKPPPPKKLVVKNSASWSEKNTSSLGLLLAVIAFRQFTG